MSVGARRLVRTELVSRARGDGWRLGVAYGHWPPCSVCARRFGEGEVLLFRARDQRLLCIGCAAASSLTDEEVLS